MTISQENIRDKGKEQRGKEKQRTNRRYIKLGAKIAWRPKNPPAIVLAEPNIHHLWFDHSS